MPTLLETRQIHVEFADLGRMCPKRRVYDGPRSRGLHLSGVIKYVLESGGLLTPDELGDLMPLRMCVGMAAEAFIVQLWPDLFWQPGEVQRDGIFGSPDGITFEEQCSEAEVVDIFADPDLKGMPATAVLEEIKATWLSRLEKGTAKGVTPSPRDITKQKRWMLQLAGYCHMMGLTKARLHVWWINGDYRGSGPQYFTYLIEFTKAELKRTWENLILTNVSGARAEVN